MIFKHKLKFLALLIAAQLLVACSSSHKKQNEGADAGIDDSMNADAPIADQQAKSTSGGAAPKSSTANSSALADAIRSGNDDMIYRNAIQTLAQNSSDVTALNALGIYHFHRRHPLAAQLMFDRALKAPNVSAQMNSSIHNNLGLVELVQGKDKAALTEFKKAVELNSHNAEAAFNLGTYYLRQKDYPKAYAALDKGFSSSSKDAKWLNNFAIVSAWHGNLEQADSYYQKALAALPGNADIMLNYAILKIEYQHKPKDGLDLLDRIKVMGTPDSLKNAMNVLEIHAKASLK